MKFTTKTDVIDQLIIPAIESRYEYEYDTDAIFNEAFDFVGGGFVQTADEAEFWEIVAKHAK